MCSPCYRFKVDVFKIIHEIWDTFYRIICLFSTFNCRNIVLCKHYQTQYLTYKYPLLFFHFVQRTLSMLYDFKIPQPQPISSLPEFVATGSTLKKGIFQSFCCQSRWSQTLEPIIWCHSSNKRATQLFLQSRTWHLNHLLCDDFFRASWRLR